MTTTLAAPPHPPSTTPVAHRPRLRRVHHEPEAGGPDPPVPADPACAPLPQRPTPSPRAAPPAHPAPVPEVATPEQLAAAHRAIARVLRLAMEVLDGRRQPTQLASHVEPRVLRYWRVVTQQRTVRRPARPTRMRLCLPHPGVAEVAVVCDIDGAVRALAARFERAAGDRTAWRCTALRLL